MKILHFSDRRSVGFLLSCLGNKIIATNLLKATALFFSMIEITENCKEKFQRVRSYKEFKIELAKNMQGLS